CRSSRFFYRRSAGFCRPGARPREGLSFHGQRANRSVAHGGAAGGRVGKRRSEGLFSEPVHRLRMVAADQRTDARFNRIRRDVETFDELITRERHRRQRRQLHLLHGERELSAHLFDGGSDMRIAGDLEREAIAQESTTLADWRVAKHMPKAERLYDLRAPRLVFTHEQPRRVGVRTPHRLQDSLDGPSISFAINDKGDEVRSRALQLALYFSRASERFDCAVPPEPLRPLRSAGVVLCIKEIGGRSLISGHNRLPTFTLGEYSRGRHV